MIFLAFSLQTPEFKSEDDFLYKLDEEVDEVDSSILGEGNIEEEIFDVMQVCLTYLKSHYTIDEITQLNVKHLKKMEERYNAKD